jgi:L-2,4-diaminobutyrate decarboxylase
MNKLPLLYDPELFAEVAKSVTAELKNHLEEARQPESSVMGKKTPDELIELARAALNGFDFNSASIDQTRKQTIGRAQDLARTFLSTTTKLHSPNYMGHQVNPPVPVATAFAALGATLNPGLAVYEMSQFGFAIERALIEKLGPFIGWKKDSYDGIITSGGTLANLTAILSARNRKYPQAFATGLAGKKPAILTSQDSHYSISRAAGVMGLGADSVFKVPLDRKRRLDPQALDRIFNDAQAKGFEPFCIVASSGSTPYGAFDPLSEIADFAEKHQLWFHVDGAHGASLLLSNKLKSRLTGIERADSITWDAHKMMFVPSLCTFLLYRNKQESYLPFQQDAPYIFANDPARAVYDSGLRTFECTKGSIALPVWALWSLFSDQVFTLLIESVCAATHEFYRMVKNAPDFEALHEPECNIFCFRYQPPGRPPLSVSEHDVLQRKIRERLIKDGRFYITGTVIDGAYALRVTIINPRSEAVHFRGLLDSIREIAKL